MSRGRAAAGTRYCSLARLPCFIHLCQLATPDSLILSDAGGPDAGHRGFKCLRSAAAGAGRPPAPWRADAAKAAPAGSERGPGEEGSHAGHIRPPRQRGGGVLWEATAVSAVAVVALSWRIHPAAAAVAGARPGSAFAADAAAIADALPGGAAPTATATDVAGAAPVGTAKAAVESMAIALRGAAAVAAAAAAGARPGSAVAAADLDSAERGATAAAAGCGGADDAQRVGGLGGGPPV